MTIPVFQIFKNDGKDVVVAEVSRRLRNRGRGEGETPDLAMALLIWSVQGRASISAPFTDIESRQSWPQSDAEETR